MFGFSNKNTLTKTLRFSIEPTVTTKNNIKKNGIINNDLLLEKDKNIVKDIIKNYNKEFINNSLENAVLNFGEYIEYTKNKKYKEANAIIKKFNNFFTSNPNYSIVVKGGEGIGVILKDNPLLDRFKSRSVLFDETFKKYKFIYESDKKGTIAHRVFKENLPIFTKNINIVNKNNIDGLFDKNCFDIEYYNNCLKQTGIDTYNNIISDLNIKINEYNQKNKVKIPRLRQLYKQILIDEESKYDLDRFTKDNLVEEINKYGANYKNFFIESINFLSNIFEYDIDNIYIDNTDKLSKYLYNSYKIIKNAKGSSLKDIANSNEDFVINFKKVFIELSNNIINDFDTLINYNDINKSVIPNIENIQNYFRFFKIFNSDKSYDDFYIDYLNIFKRLSSIDVIFNCYRDYITSKNKNKKLRLWFGKGGEFGEGFTNDAKGMTFIRKNGLYYLVVINNNSILKTPEWNGLNANGECFDKMLTMKLANNISRQAKKLIENGKFNCPKEFLDNNGQLLKKEPTQELLPKLIDSYKELLDVSETGNGISYKKYNFNFKNSSDYASLDDFLDDVKNQGYLLNMDIKIPVSYIDELEKNNDIYLFKVYSKDFSPYSKGNKNLNTMYFLELFNNNPNYKLNGGVELFFREKSINYDDSKWELGHHYEELKDKFSYPIIKDKRYALDKFLLHIPIEIYPSANKNDINIDINEYIKNNKDVNIIGIDRGERNLIYLTLMNQNGNILQQESLNIINDKDYQALIKDNIKNRKEYQKNYEDYDGIKNIKDGYLSHVVHKVSKMAVDNNAIIVLEGLNFGNNRGGKFIEAQVYKKFEIALINKLNCYVDKNKEYGELGSISNPLQLTKKIDKVEDLDKINQSGIVYFVNPEYTSSICPVTGFVNLFNFEYTNIEKSQKFYNKFDNIGYDGVNFVFKFDYSKFDTFRKPYKNNWVVISSDDTRFYSVKLDGVWKQIECAVTTDLKNLFIEYDISFHDLKKQIVEQNSKKFFIGLNRILLNLFRVRHTNKDDDYILSPVYPFFNSKTNKDSDLPKDSDANGAYHIAQKGLVLLNKLNGGKLLDKQLVNMLEWFEYKQKNDFDMCLMM